MLERDELVHDGLVHDKLELELRGSDLVRSCGVKQVQHEPLRWRRGRSEQLWHVEPRVCRLGLR